MTSLVQVQKRNRRNQPKKDSIMEKVFSAIEKVGYLNVHPTTAAIEFNTSAGHVTYCKQRYLQIFGVPQVDIFSKEVYLQNTAIMNKLARDCFTRIDGVSEFQNRKFQLDSIKMFMDFVQAHTEFLEAFGFKEKVAEKFDVRQATVQLCINGVDLPYDFFQKKEEVTLGAGASDEARTDASQ